MCRALQRANRPLKTTFRAHERDEGTRVLFQDMASTLEAKRLVVIDESGVSVGMPPAYSRAPVGNRAYSKVPFNRGRHYTLLASLLLSGLSTPLVIEGAANTRQPSRQLPVNITHVLSCSSTALPQSR